MDYKKPQSTLVQGGMGIYPLTTADQVILADGSRLEKDGRISADSAANSAKLGGKAPEYYIQPRNLLDNSDFRNPVNQRGLTTYNYQWNYTIDRWIIASVSTDGVPSLDITDSGITITNTTGNNIYFLQRVPKSLITSGNNYTLAYQKSDGTIVVTIVANFEEIGSESYQIVYVIPSGTTIVWAALYEGSYTAETLPPYVPKGYAAELAECQRYYYRLQNGTNFIFRLRNQHETNNYAAFDICPCITFPVPMRIVPTVSITYDITDGTLSVGAPFDCSRTSCTVPDVSIPHGGWFDLSSLVASADL